MSPSGRPSGAGRSGRPRKPRERRSLGTVTGAPLEPVGLVTLALWAVALIAASPEHVELWGLNGLRSVPAHLPAVLLAAGIVLTLAVVRPRNLWVWVAVGGALAWVVAFPLREQIHFLGDTQLRMRALFAASLPAPGSGVSDAWSWLKVESQILHASPLDMVVDVIPVLILHARGLAVADSVALVAAVLAVAYLALGWRLAGRLAAAPALRGPLALALVLTGGLEAFAGYADSAALIAVVAFGWWGEILSPLDRPAQAWWVSAWFVVLLLSHRMTVVMLTPQLLRAWGPAIPGDRPEARRLLLALTALAVAIGAVLAMVGGMAQQVFRDIAELARSAGAWSVRPLDVLSAVVVVAPLALAAPGLAGRSPFWREPRAWWVVSGALPLLVGLLWVFPVGENGLGAHRDWDTNVLLGVTLMVGAAAWLASAGLPKLQTALVGALPLLALTSFSWLAANADPAVATRRAIALAKSPTALTAPQRAHLDVYFGQRAMDEHRPQVAALHYQAAFEGAGNPRRALMAAEAWLMAGRPREARAAIEAARSTGPLSNELESGARALEARIAAADSTTAK